MFPAPLTPKKTLCHKVLDHSPFHCIVRINIVLTAIENSHSDIKTYWLNRICYSFSNSNASGSEYITIFYFFFASKNRTQLTTASTKNSILFRVIEMNKDWLLSKLINQSVLNRFSLQSCRYNHKTYPISVLVPFDWAGRGPQKSLSERLG